MSSLSSPVVASLSLCGCLSLSFFQVLYFSSFHQKEFWKLDPRRRGGGGGCLAHNSDPNSPASCSPVLRDRLLLSSFFCLLLLLFPPTHGCRQCHFLGLSPPLPPLLFWYHLSLALKNHLPPTKRWCSVLEQTEKRTL